jgi:hypothetical protein
MASSSKAHQPATITSRAGKNALRWLLFVHQLPSKPSNLRVRTWRRLQQLGAIHVKQAVYILPDTPNAREDFEWLETEVKDAGGDASVFVADTVDKWSNDALIEEFRRSRQETYLVLATDIERVLTRVAGKRRPSGTRAPAVARLLDLFRQRFTAVEALDFFGSAGRDRVLTLLARLEASVSMRQPRPTTHGRSSDHDTQHFRGRRWVTRPRPGVDRMASAWLIRRFIDPEAEFVFASDRDAAPPEAIPFDMFGVEFTHRAGACTFETLCAEFGLGEPALARVAAIVHDLDLKDARFGAPETAAMGLLIEGLRLSCSDDAALLAQGRVMFEALYRAFAHAERPSGPRALASKPQRRRSARARSARNASS